MRNYVSPTGVMDSINLRRSVCSFTREKPDHATVRGHGKHCSCIPAGHLSQTHKRCTRAQGGCRAPMPLL